MNLAIVEEDLLLRQVFASVFRSRGHAVHEVRSSDDLPRIAALQPLDVCLFDPDHAMVCGPFRGLADVRAIRPEMSLVAYTSSLDLQATARLRAAGVDAVISKTSDLDSVVAAVEGEARRRREPIAAALRAHRAEPYGVERLTPREHEVLLALSQGASTPRIARQMQISLATTRSHVQNVLRKLGAHSRLEAVALAVESGLLPQGPNQPWVTRLDTGHSHRTAAVS